MATTAAPSEPNDEPCGDGPYRTGQGPLPEKTEERLVMLRDVLAAVAHESVRISPYPVPVDLEIVLRKAHALLKEDQGFESPIEWDPDFLLRKLTRRQLYGLIEDHLKAIPEFRRWNITKAEQDEGYTDPEDPNRPVQLVAVGMGMKPRADNDFVDLDAHIQNTTRLAWDQSKPEDMPEGL